MSQTYSFVPLDVRPSSPLDVTALGMRHNGEAPTGPQWEPNGAKAISTTDLTEVSYFDDGKNDSQSTFETTTLYNPGKYASRSDNLDRWIPMNNDNDSVRTSLLQRNTRKFATTWGIAVLTVITTAFTVFYSYRVMVDRNALPSALQLQPGATVLVINVLSHIVAYLCWALFRDTMEALRWALACRPRGVLLTSFLALSRATSLTGVFYLCKAHGSHRIWALQSNEPNATQHVIGGLLPVSSNGLGDIPPAYLSLYASVYTMGFMTDPKYVVSVAPVACSGPGCLSIFLPGGMEVVRVDDGTGNNTLFNGDYAGDYSAIVVNDAPGYQMEYGLIEAVDSDFQFNNETDCKMYLESVGDGLLICTVEKGDILYLGWNICPLTLYYLNACYIDLSWTETIRWNTTVAMYSRRATVAYDSQNISILSVESISEPIQVPVNMSDFNIFVDVVFAPVPAVVNRTANASSYNDAIVGFNVDYGVGYILRLFERAYNSYSDGGLSVLRGIIAVPFQFSTAMQQIGIGEKPGAWAAPDVVPLANHVTATLSKTAYRALIQPWTVCTFGLFAALVTTWSIACLVWISCFGPHSPNTSCFPEVNITSKCSTQPVRKVGNGPQFETANDLLEDLGKLTRTNGLGNGTSTKVIQAIRGKRVYCGSSPGSREGERVIVLVTQQGQVKLLNQHEKYS